MAAFRLTETRGNLFHLPETYSLAHAVPADLETQKGSIAWKLSLIFGRIDEPSKQQLYTGNMAIMEHNNRFIYYLLTKETIYEKSTYENIRLALICMREHMHSHEITKLAMPRICCGKDGLKWQSVRELIMKVFEHCYNVEIIVCEHTPCMSPRCRITEVTDNTFIPPPDYSIVHSVSADFVLNKGFGMVFKHKVGQINEQAKEAKHTGTVCVLRESSHYVYHLVTTERNHEKCSYPALYYAILAMRDHMLQHHVNHLAIPRMGYSVDRSTWHHIKHIFELVFNDDNVGIMVHYRPSASAHSVAPGMRSTKLKTIE